MIAELYADGVLRERRDDATRRIARQTLRLARHMVGEE